MRFRKLLAAIVLATVLLLTGCVKNSNPDAEKSTRVKYAKAYNPDGTLLVEGEYGTCIYGNCVVTIEINGVKYQTAYTNVVTMQWDE